MADPAIGDMTRLTRRYVQAVDDARLIHAIHKRKETDIPYFSHVLSVSAIVLEFGGDEDQAIAGLLHDAVEDGGGLARLEMIRVEYGDDVAKIVSDLSDVESKAIDGPKPPWIDRKVPYIDRIEMESARSLLVCAADKLANLTSTRSDHRQLGTAVWARFRTGRAGQLWYYTEVARVVSKTLVDGRPAQLAAELAAQIAELRAQIIAIEGVDEAALDAEVADIAAQAAAVRAAANR